MGCPPEYGTPFGGFSLLVNAERAHKAERLFARISDGGKVTMPLEKPFWAERFGMCTDRSRVVWTVDSEGRVKE